MEMTARPSDNVEPDEPHQLVDLGEGVLRGIAHVGQATDPVPERTWRVATAEQGESRSQIRRRSGS